jgi:hypothetical protein
MLFLLTFVFFLASLSIGYSAKSDKNIG